MIADKDYYRDKDGNLVDEADESAAFLVAGKGTEIPADVVEKYGLDKVAQEEAEEKPVKSAKPSSNKSKTPKENK